jgi:transmembrane sensor
MPQQGSVDVIAAEWAARLDGRSLSDDDARAFDAWVAEHPGNRGAFIRAQAVLAYMDAQFVRDTMMAAPAVSASRRRALVSGAVVAAGAVAASVAAVMFRQNDQVLRYNTGKGQIRDVTLSDGSLITLDTDSKINVELLSHERRIERVSGRALFHVAKDKARPFIVTAGALKVRAVGTSFAVRNWSSAPLEVLVQEGIVDVASPKAANPLRVGANMRVAMDSVRGGPISVSKVEPAALANALAWSGGMLSFEDVKLEVAAMEFARYSDQRIIISDPAIGAITITGLFSAQNPADFATAAGESLGLKVKIKPDAIYLSRK